MSNYIIYKSAYGECVVEVLNSGEQELLNVESTLVKNGFIITEVCGQFIKCHAINQGEETI